MRRRTPLVLIVLCLAVAAGSAQEDEEPYIPDGIPDDLAAALRSRDAQEIVDLGLAKLREHMGDPMPRFEATLRRRTVAIPTEFLGKRTAYLLAGGTCSTSVAWVEHLRSNDWEVEGFEQLVVITNPMNPDPYNQLVPKKVARFQVDFPWPGYLAYVYWSPTMVFADEHGNFQGYQYTKEDQPVLVEDSLSTLQESEEAP